MISTQPAAANTKGEKLAQRLSCILALLHQGSPLNKHQLAERFGVDVRTIERDLHQRLQGIAERAPEGGWRLSHTARGTVPARYLFDYAQLAGTTALFPDASTPYLITQLETTPTARGLHVQAMPEEDLRTQSQAFAQLQQAVQQRHPCHFTYKGKPRHVHPYRLTHKNGIWYLAAAEVEGDWLKTFSVARIEDLRVQENERFTRNPAHIEYIDQQQDIWFTLQATEVTLRVSAEMAHYFTRRDQLPHQNTRLDSDGSLLLTARIHHPQQLLPIVRYWMPHVRILEPVEWEQMLIDSVQQAICQWQPEAVANEEALWE